MSDFHFGAAGAQPARSRRQARRNRSLRPALAGAACALAVLTGAAQAEPTRLSAGEMDTVSAGMFMASPQLDALWALLAGLGVALPAPGVSISVSEAGPAPAPAERVAPAPIPTPTPPLDDGATAVSVEARASGEQTSIESTISVSVSATHDSVAISSHGSASAQSCCDASSTAYATSSVSGPADAIISIQEGVAVVGDTRTATTLFSLRSGMDW